MELERGDIGRKHGMVLIIALTRYDTIRYAIFIVCSKVDIYCSVPLTEKNNGKKLKTKTILSAEHKYRKLS